MLGVDRHRRADGPAAAHLRRPAAARRHRRRGRRRWALRGGRGAVHRRRGSASGAERDPRRSRGRLAVDDARRLARGRGSRGCAARRSASRSARCRRAAPRSRRSSPTRPSGAWRSTRSEFGQRRDRRRGGAGGGQQCVGGGHAGAAADARAADPADRGDHAGGLPAFQPPARARCCSSTSRELVWALIASLYVGNVMLLVLNLPLVGVWVKLLTIPRPLLYAGILVFATLGVYSLSNSITDVLLDVRDRRSSGSSCGASTSRSRRRSSASSSGR